MAEYFETDLVTKDYDSRIVRRLMGYLKPYKAIVVAVLVSLALGTAGELFVPILVRRIVDDALMPSWRSIDAAALAARQERRLEIKPDDPRIDGRVYVPASRLAALPASLRTALSGEGILDPSPRYLVRVEADNPAQARVLAARASLFSRGGDWAAIDAEALRALPAAEARDLRGPDMRFLRVSTLLIFVALCLTLAASFVQVWAANLVGQRVMKDLRMQLFRHSATRSLAFLSRQPVGRLVTRMTSDIETINQFFTDVVSAFLKDAALMSGVLMVLLFLDWRLGLVLLATLPPTLIATALARTRARDAFRRQRQWLSKVNAYIAEHLAGVSVVKLFVREAAAQKSFEEHDRELMRANLGEMYVYATFRPVVDFLANLSTAAIIYVGAFFLKLNLLSLGTLIAFVNLIRMFFSPVQDIAEKYTLLQSAMAGGERVFALLDAQDSIPDEGRTPMPSRLRGHIEFDHVWFAYKEGEWVLKDLTLSVNPGEMVAIVGYTGAGKTTVANLITRLWDVQKGQIRLDGIPLRELPLAELRRAVQPVPQDVFLFTGSVESNLRLGEQISAERARLAAKAVNAEHFIEKMPGGYEAQLSEGASNISQGQKQLLSFARVLAHDPAIIILDEATSSVDTETERLIQRGLKALLSGRTSIVIAHRLSTIKHASRIVVLSQGRVVESGSHDELLAKKGLYWNLYRLQFGGGAKR